MNLLGKFYQWFWFHTEFWLTPIDRRPYTFIMRDWVFTHQVATAVMTIAWFAGIVVWHSVAAIVLAVVSGLLFGHLIWGTAWIEGEQEVPTYLDAGNDEKIRGENENEC